MPTETLDLNVFSHEHSGLDPELRRARYTGNDVAAIIGVHPYRTAWDVFAVKTGLVEDKIETNEAMTIGTALQLPVAYLYQKKTGNAVRWLDMTRAHPTDELAACTPDGEVAQLDLFGRRIGYEGKVHGAGQAYRYGPDWSDEYPANERVQCVWNCYVMGWDMCDLNVLLGASTMTVRTYRVEPAEGEIDEMVSAVRAFHCDHVLTRTPPTISPSKLADKFLKELPVESDFREPLPEEYEWIEELAQIKSSATVDKTRQAELETLLKGSIGRSAGLLWGNGKLTYKHTRGRESVDWEAVARHFAGQLGLDAPEIGKVVSKYTVAAPPIRRFVLKVKGKEVEE